MSKENKKIRKGLSYTNRRKLSYAIFLVPFLAGFFLLFLGIYYNSLKFSFNVLEMKGAEGYTLSFAGLDNYKFALFTDPDFVTNIRASVMTMLTNIPLAILYSLMIAVILNSKFKGRTVFRAIYFIPVILATGFMAKADSLSAIFSQQWNSMAGTEQASVANGLIDSMDLRSFFMNLSFSPQLSGYVIGAVDQIFNIVNISGVQMLIFLAGLQSISPSIYEAADIDGCSAWEKFWLITFPMISPIIVVNVIYTIIDSFTDSENAIMTQIREQSFRSSSMGIASAMAWFYFAVIAVCIIIITLIISRYVYYQQRD
ncbi:MAG: hypothetical protein K0S47_344 [Herbinix sp.]|nr:hypothetical protein [Herbinix sp.]